MKFSSYFFTAFLTIACCFLISSPSVSKNNQDEHPYRLAIGYDASTFFETDIKDVKAAFDLWVRSVGENAGLVTEAYVYDDLAVMRADIMNGKIDMITGSSLNYLEISSVCETEIAYCALHDDAKTLSYLFVVHADSGYTSIEQLADSRLIINKDDDIGLFYYNVLLLEHDLPEAKYFFSHIIAEQSFSRALTSLFFEKGDACITSNVVFDLMKEINPQIGTRLKIIAKSPEYIPTLAFFRKGVDENIKELVRNELGNFKNTTAGRQTLMLFKIKNILPVQDNELDNLRKLKARYEALK